MSDVEFSVFVEQWFLYVFLEDEGPKTAIVVALAPIDAKFDII